MIRNRYAPTTRVTFACEGESMTKQADAYDADINVIVGKYIRGVGPDVFNARVGEFADVSSVGDFHSCQEIIRTSQEAFLTLPAKVRDAFRNDPGELAKALLDPGRRGDLEAAGIITPAASPAPTDTSAASPGAAVPAAATSGSAS